MMNVLEHCLHGLRVLQNMHNAAASFVATCSESICKERDMEWEPITAHSFKKECHECSHSAAGPDGFEPAEMACLPMVTYEEMA